MPTKRERGPGRPAVAGEPRSEELRVRITPSERAMLNDLAEKSGVLVSEYVRAALGFEK